MVKLNTQVQKLLIMLFFIVIDLLVIIKQKCLGI